VRSEAETAAPLSDSTLKDRICPADVARHRIASPTAISRASHRDQPIEALRPVEGLSERRDPA